MTKAKICTKCNILKPLDEFNNDRSRKDGKKSSCKECRRKYNQEHRKEKIEYNKKYTQEHKKEKAEYDKEHYERTGRQKQGKTSMYENKMCAAYLGIVIGERLIRHLFKDVQIMPHGNPKFDFICNKGMKIDVKTSTTHFNKNKYPFWSFTIDRNKVADFFILVAFDNRTDLNPLHLWMIPGRKINEDTSKSIALSRIHKWDKWKKDIKDAKLCCNELKRGTHLCK